MKAPRMRWPSPLRTGMFCKFGFTDDSLPVGSPVAVLGFGFWRARYGGDPGVIGKTLRIGQTLRTIIGVAPEGFVGLNDQGVPAAWIPIRPARGSETLRRGIRSGTHRRERDAISTSAHQLRVN